MSEDIIQSFGADFMEKMADINLFVFKAMDRCVLSSGNSLWAIYKEGVQYIQFEFIHCALSWVNCGLLNGLLCGLLYM